MGELIQFPLSPALVTPEERIAATIRSQRLKQLVTECEKLPVQQAYDLLQNQLVNCDEDLGLECELRDFLWEAVDHFGPNGSRIPHTSWFTKLPDTLTLYRGCHAANCIGMHWTLNHDEAVRMTEPNWNTQEKNYDVQPYMVIMTAEAKKSDVLLSFGTKLARRVLIDFYSFEDFHMILSPHSD